MTITQLLIDLSVLAGVLLMTVLAVVPLWLEHAARRADDARVIEARRRQPGGDRRVGQVRPATT